MWDRGNMIHIKYERNHCNSGMELMNVREAPAHKAFSSMVEAELAWGGRVTKLSKTEVQVCTSVLGSLDQSTFTGTPEEMGPLYRVAGLYAVIRHTLHKEVLETGARLAVGGKPNLISMCSGMLLGQPAAKLAIFAFLELSEEEMGRMAGIRMEDLCAAIELNMTEGVSVREILS